MYVCEYLGMFIFWQLPQTAILIKFAEYGILIRGSVPSSFSPAFSLPLLECEGTEKDMKDLFIKQM